jgi:hypothetical protein
MRLVPALEVDPRVEPGVVITAVSRSYRLSDHSSPQAAPSVEVTPDSHEHHDDLADPLPQSGFDE